MVVLTEPNKMDFSISLADFLPPPGRTPLPKPKPSDVLLRPSNYTPAYSSDEDEEEDQGTTGTRTGTGAGDEIKIEVDTDEGISISSSFSEDPNSTVDTVGEKDWHHLSEDYLSDPDPDQAEPLDLRVNASLPPPQQNLTESNGNGKPFEELTLGDLLDRQIKFSFDNKNAYTRCKPNN